MLRLEMPNGRKQKAAAKQTKKCKIVLVYDCDYDPEKFSPSLDGNRDQTDLYDVAHFGDMLSRYQEKTPGESGYQLGEVTAYTLDGFLADLAEGKISNEA